MRVDAISTDMSIRRRKCGRSNCPRSLRVPTIPAPMSEKWTHYLDPLAKCFSLAFALERVPQQFRRSPTPTSLPPTSPTDTFRTLG
jgi:hypothetical protein